MINIEAFTFDYDEVEDRIRVSGNLYNGLPAISFWLTRKLTLKLLNAAEGLVHKTSPVIVKTPAQHKSAMALFEHQNAELALASAIKHRSAEKSEHPVVKETPVTQILGRLDISYRPEKYTFKFYGIDESPLATSVVGYNEFHQLLSLMHRGALHLNWGVDQQLFVHTQSAEFTLQ